MGAQTKIILHLDMNSYFASVEQQANPHLRRVPVGVCEHLGGLIIAPSVEAKRLGIKLGTPVWEARKIYPEIVLLPVDPEKYRSITRKFLRILLDYGAAVEKASIDEAFLDLSDTCQTYDEALLVGLEIKQRLRQEVGEWMSCSIGLGPNKLVAKLAADLGEGDIDRIFAVRPAELDHLYRRLKLTDIPGIGRRLEQALLKLGIRSLRQLASYPVENLLNQFGVASYFLHQAANFQDTAELVTPEEEEIKSMGYSYTLPRVITDEREIKKLMMKLAEKIGRRLRAAGAAGNVLHYFHSDKQYHSFHRQQKFQEFIDDGKAIYDVAWRIFSAAPLNGSRGGLKIMALTVSGLQFGCRPQPLLPEFQKPVWLTRATDLLNDKYGEFVVRRGRLADIPAEWAKDTVGFERMKEFSF